MKRKRIMVLIIILVAVITTTAVVVSANDEYDYFVYLPFVSGGAMHGRPTPRPTLTPMPTQTPAAP